MNETLGRIEEFGRKLIKKDEAGKWNRKSLIAIILVAIFVILSIILSSFFIFESVYVTRFYPGTKIGNVDLSGLTREEALASLIEKTGKFDSEGIPVYFQSNRANQLKITSVIDSLTDPDLSREIINFDVHKTVYEAFDFGRNGSWSSRISRQWLLFWHFKKFPIDYNLDESAVKDLLAQQFGSLESKSNNAKPEIVWSGNSYQVNFLTEKTGQYLNYQEVVNKINERLKNLSLSPIEIKLEEKKPAVSLGEAEANKALVDNILSTTTPTFYFENLNWNIAKKDLSKMLEFDKLDGNVILSVNKQLFIDWAKKNIEAKFNIQPLDAKVEIKDGVISRLQAHQIGRILDLDKTYNSLLAVLNSPASRIKISYNEILPKTATGDVNDIGVKELLGVGKSNFAGSPSNRRHNIATGATKLHGVLIAPDETFSLISNLGNIDASGGYLTELVIKDNKTTPEYGGGLCQIGTTVFRAAMASGLPIKERRNHSYSVTYYLENGLPGTDATIYDPSPDLKFTNNTGNYILIQSKIVGNDLTFEFWGTSDGRKAERTVPKVWGWISPAPTRYVYTSELKPGQKKCTEKAHKGVKASFDYMITYKDGTVDKQNFYSVYKPWQEVCLIGGDPNSSSTPVTTGTSTKNISTSTASLGARS